MKYLTFNYFFDISMQSAIFFKLLQISKKISQFSAFFGRKTIHV